VEEKYLPLPLLVAFIQRLFPSTIVSSIARGTRGRVCHTDISLLTSMLILDTIFTTAERERGSFLRVAAGPCGGAGTGCGWYIVVARARLRQHIRPRTTPRARDKSRVSIRELVACQRGIDIKCSGAMSLPRSVRADTSRGEGMEAGRFGE